MIDDKHKAMIIFSKEQMRYLKKRAKETSIPVSVYIRILVEEDMKKTNEYKMMLKNKGYQNSNDNSNMKMF